MGCVPAPSCKAALAEATVRWPARSRASDGICASAQHTVQNPTSDHELGNAWDLTHDPQNGVDCHVLAEQVSNDPRVKYTIWNRRIKKPGRPWLPYTGANPHTKHMHVSIRSDARDTTGPWFPLPAVAPALEDEMRFPIDLPAGPPGPDGLVPIWRLTGPDGGVQALNGAPFHGSLPHLGIVRADIVGIVPRSDRDGYTLTSSPVTQDPAGRWVSPTFSFPV